MAQLSKLAKAKFDEIQVKEKIFCLRAPDFKSQIGLYLSNTLWEQKGVISFGGKVGKTCADTSVLFWVQHVTSAVEGEEKFTRNG